MSLAIISLYGWINAIPALATIGSYGLAIVGLTIVIKLVLWPVYHFQLASSRKAMEGQRRLAPELSQLRKKYKSEPQKLNQETMKLYRENGVNPLGNMIGCLPALVQSPILIALYYVIQSAPRSAHLTSLHFLFVPDLTQIPSQHALVPGLPIPTFVYLVVPLLAAATTFVQSKMIQQPPNPYASEQEQQTQQMAQSFQVMMPLMILFFAISTPAGLALYWFISNCVAIVQQYFVTGWGALPILGRRNATATAMAAASARSGAGAAVVAATSRPVPPRRGPDNGRRPSGQSQRRRSRR
jgi:YidC/Oxa1 family membrane protein insertase